MAWILREIENNSKTSYYDCDKCGSTWKTVHGRSPKYSCECETGFKVLYEECNKILRKGVHYDNKGRIVCDCGESIFREGTISFDTKCCCGKKVLDSELRPKRYAKILSVLSKDQIIAYRKIGGEWFREMQKGGLCDEWRTFENFCRDTLSTYTVGNVLLKYDKSEKHSKTNSCWGKFIVYSDESVLDEVKKLFGFEYVSIDKQYVYIRCKTCNSIHRRTKYKSRYNPHDTYRCPTCYKSKKKEAKVRKNTDACGLYYIRIVHEGNVYYKIGITTRTVEQRFAGCNLDIATIFFKNYPTFYEAYDEEQSILKTHQEHRLGKDTNLLAGNGRTECFYYDVLQLDAH